MLWMGKMFGGQEKGKRKHSVHYNCVQQQRKAIQDYKTWQHNGKL